MNALNAQLRAAQRVFESAPDDEDEWVGERTDDLVRELDTCFSEFDAIIKKHKLEKIKTIGDSYMCAGGVPHENRTNPVDCVLAGLKMVNYMARLKQQREAQGLPAWEIRLGIHTGHLVAGVIGQEKFAYDIWGDTVNLASRMESSGLPMQVNISAATFEAVKDFFDCEFRGQVSAKNKGEVSMYLVRGVKSELKGADGQLNQRFVELYSNLRT